MSSRFLSRHNSLSLHVSELQKHENDKTIKPAVAYVNWKLLHWFRLLLLKAKIHSMNSTDYVKHGMKTSLWLFALALLVRVSSTTSVQLAPSNANKRRYPGSYPRLIRAQIEPNGKTWTERLSLDLYPVMKYTRKINISHREAIMDPGRLPKFESEDCRAQYTWQQTSHPTCNLIHEFDLAEVSSQLIANGYWRDVWKVQDETVAVLDQSFFIFKTLRYQHEYNHPTYDRHRRDAIATGRLSKSTFVLNIYGFCGTSGFFEYGNGGDIMDAIWSRDNDNQTSSTLSKLDKLTIGK